jgi:hypothetical protein
LQDLVAGSIDADANTLTASTALLDTDAYNALFGRTTYSEAQACQTMHVACVNDTHQPTEIARDGRPVPRRWRSVHLSDCAHTLLRSPTVTTDQQALDTALVEIQQAYESVLVATFLELVWDVLESAVWVCAF